MLTDFPLPHLRVDTDSGYAPDIDEIIGFITANHVVRGRT
jgi:hypothetical protein